MKTDIHNREDIAALVQAFYDKIRGDSVLGPIFNDMISNWEQHLEHLTTFWDCSLFMTSKRTQSYSGNPIKAHIKVDDFTKNSIGEKHFGIWLNHWVQTIDDMFEGDTARKAKLKARKMATFIHIKIFEARPN